MILDQRVTPGTCARLRFRRVNARWVLTLRVTLGLAAVFIVAACDGGPTSPPAAGTLRVSITTTGGDHDEDGYELIAASRTRFVGPQSSVSIDGVEPGTHVLEMKRLADNCSVVGANPRSIIVEAGRVASDAFEVACDPTGILVETTTTGSDQPALGYAAVSGLRSAFVGPTGSVVISRLDPSSHTVSLSRVADNCSVADDSARTVVVEHRKVTRVAFAISCINTDARVALVLDSLENRVFSSWIAIADARGRGIATPLLKGHSPTWSPDRTKLLYSNADCDFYYATGCTGGLVVRDAATGIESIPPAGRAGVDPSWSPDGRYIAFARDSVGNAKLHVIDFDGVNLQLATPGVIDVRSPSWSPDSKRLVFQCRIGLNEVDICLINSDGTGFKRMRSSSLFSGNPEWSPDGARIAFTTVTVVQFPGASDEHYVPSIALIAPDGTDFIRLTDGRDPSWSPDGSKLVFARTDGLFTVNADGSGAAKITTGYHRAPSWRR